MKSLVRKNFFSYVFLAFLVVYFFIMLSHIEELSLSLTTVIFFVAGLSLAIFAHSRKNYITIILLVVHMSIEWFEWSQVGFSTTGGTFVNIIHILMDFIFLSHELSAHLKKYRYLLLTVVVIVLSAIFSLSKYFLAGGDLVEMIIPYVNPFVIGGILGCVGSHLAFHVRGLVKTKGHNADC